MTVVASQFNTIFFNARPHTTGVSETDEGDTTDTPTDLTERFNYDEDCKKSALRTLRDAEDGTTVATGAYLASRDHNVGVDDNETLLYEVVGVVPDEADVDEWVSSQSQTATAQSETQSRTTETEDQRMSSGSPNQTASSATQSQTAQRQSLTAVTQADSASPPMSVSYSTFVQFIQQVTYWAYHDGYARGYGVEDLTDANKRVIDSGWQEWHDRESIYKMEGAPEPPSESQTPTTQSDRGQTTPVTEDEDTE